MTQATASAPRLVTLRELSRIVRLPQKWLLAETMAGRLPCLRVGKKLRFNPVAVEFTLAQLAAGEVAHAS
jgi:hypothetical protein